MTPRGGDAPDGRRVQEPFIEIGRHALNCELRLTTLFTVPDPTTFRMARNSPMFQSNSLIVIPAAKIEPSVAVDPVQRGQFERPDTS
jgi:hypothetical protein